ncbi:MAG TPA: hypothetical protein VN969_32195 [Streptosporangiaceae bacterium]|nr:hypothetical protein [Streptosporangiaceae bacterium]
MTAEPVTGHDDGEELPGSSPSAVPGTVASTTGLDLHRLQAQATPDMAGPSVGLVLPAPG